MWLNLESFEFDSFKSKSNIKVNLNYSLQWTFSSIFTIFTDKNVFFLPLKNRPLNDNFTLTTSNNRQNRGPCPNNISIVSLSK